MHSLSLNYVSYSNKSVFSLGVTNMVILLVTVDPMMLTSVTRVGRLATLRGNANPSLKLLPLFAASDVLRNWSKLKAEFLIEVLTFE